MLDTLREKMAARTERDAENRRRFVSQIIAYWGSIHAVLKELVCGISFEECMDITCVDQVQDDESDQTLTRFRTINVDCIPERFSPPHHSRAPSAFERREGSAFITSVVDCRSTFTPSASGYHCGKDATRPFHVPRALPNDLVLFVDEDIRMSSLEKEAAIYGKDALMYTIVPHKAAGSHKHSVFKILGDGTIDERVCGGAHHTHQMWSNSIDALIMPKPRTLMSLFDLILSSIKIKQEWTDYSVESRAIDGHQSVVFFKQEYIIRSYFGYYERRFGLESHRISSVKPETMGSLIVMLFQVGEVKRVSVASGFAEANFSLETWTALVELTGRIIAAGSKTALTDADYQCVLGNDETMLFSLLNNAEYLYVPTVVIHCNEWKAAKQTSGDQTTPPPTPITQSHTDSNVLPQDVPIGSDQPIFYQFS